MDFSKKDYILVCMLVEAWVTVLTNKSTYKKKVHVYSKVPSLLSKKRKYNLKKINKSWVVKEK